MTANSNLPMISVVIPAYGRVEPLKYTLRSAAVSIAKSGYEGEIIVVDDGSEPPMEERLAGFDAHHPVRFVRQANQGSIVARLTGLHEAKGMYIQFLDSDDLLHSDKLREQVRVMELENLDVSYTDVAKTVLAEDYEVASFELLGSVAETSDSLDFFTKVQPSLHAPVYRREYLLNALKNPIIPQDRIFDPSGDIWLYRALTLYPAKVRKVPGAYAGIGPHEEGRYSLCWEKLGVASLGIDEAFMAATAGQPSAGSARRLLGERAYASWRLLPHDVPREYDRRMIALWQSTRSVKARRSRGPFGMVDAALSPWLAGKIYRRLRRPSYAECKTLRSKEEFAALVAKLPTPPRAAQPPFPRPPVRPPAFQRPSPKSKFLATDWPPIR
ncbi:MAG: glycosyltransferase family A protein [Akkermansiaceae bacterium]